MTGGRLAIVIPTKDRPDHLKTVLTSLRDQIRPPDLVVVVDSTAEPQDWVVPAFAESLNVLYRHHSPPSATAQRNAGARAVPENFAYVGFLDDDIVLEKDAIATMAAFWDAAPRDVGLAQMNIQNPTAGPMQVIKRSRWFSRLGLYSSRPGGVAPSGWQAVFPVATKDLETEWLASCGLFGRRETIMNNAFDEFFDTYSYLEDLDLSYHISRKQRLVVVAASKFWHYPAPAGRIGAFRFGRYEVRNRIYFVRKHGLSLVRCYAVLIMRIAMTAASGVFSPSRFTWNRLRGNIVEFFKFGTTSKPRPDSAAPRP